MRTVSPKMQFYDYTNFNFARFFGCLLIILLQGHTNSHAYMVENNPYRHLEALDPTGNYQLEWQTDMQAERVTFQVTVKTKGYVGFGLSTNGEMDGADIVIGGVRSNGESYFSDRHGVGNQMPELDTKQDWIFHAAWENQSHTFLSFSRAFDTCDPNDLPITNNRIVLIWAYGDSDDESEYHFNKRGNFNAYLLDPEYTPRIVRDANNNVVEVRGLQNAHNVKVWKIKTTFNMPAADTTYWCDMHEGPHLSSKHHIIGYDVTFPNEASRSHTHHLLIQRCVPPKGRTAQTMFKPFLKHPGQRCHIWKAPTGPIPTQYCAETIVGTAAGGLVTFFNPPHVGFPIGISKDEYYVLQVHYDNPGKLPNIKVEMQFDIFYTSQLRPNDGGILQVRIPSPGLTPSVLVPPSSTDHKIIAQCSSECTKRIFPQTIAIYSVLLHAHNSGSKARLQHFRNNEELPWVMSDDNWGFWFQRFRSLHKEVRILPGDHLVMGCTYNNTWTNGTVVGGFSSRQEMCAAWVFYHKKLDEYTLCGSDIVSEKYREYFLGVKDIKWDDPIREYVVETPASLAGHTITDVSDNHVVWDLKRRRELQQFHMSHPQVAICARELYVVGPQDIRRNSDGLIENIADPAGSVIYPSRIRPYEPKKTCSFTT